LERLGFQWVLGTINISQPDDISEKYY